MAKRKGAKRLERREGETVSEAKARRKRERDARAKAKGVDLRSAERKALDRVAGEVPTEERLRQSGGAAAIKDTTRRHRSTLLGVRLLEDIPPGLRKMMKAGTLSPREVAAAGQLISDYKHGYLSGMTTRYQERVGGGARDFERVSASQADARARYQRALAELYPELRVLVKSVVIDGVARKDITFERADRFGKQAGASAVSMALGLGLKAVADFYAMHSEG